MTTWTTTLAAPSVPTGIQRAWTSARIGDDHLPAAWTSGSEPVINSIQLYRINTFHSVAIRLNAPRRFTTPFTTNGKMRFTKGEVSFTSPTFNLSGDQQSIFKSSAGATWNTFIGNVMDLFGTGDTGTFSLSDDDFAVPAAGPTIANKPTASITEGDTYDFNITDDDQATGTLSWSVAGSGNGSIDTDGVYTPPNISANLQATIELHDSGETPTLIDSATIDVTPVFSGTIDDDSKPTGNLLPENETNTFEAGDDVSVGDTPSWSVVSGGGAIVAAADGLSAVYTPPNINIATQEVVIRMTVGTETDDYTFTVTQVLLPQIGNKIASLRENLTHDFNVENAGNATGTLSWEVLGSGKGTIDSNGLYDPHDVSVPDSVTVRLLDDTTERDRDVFDVTPVFDGSITNKITTLRADATHTFTATASDQDVPVWSVTGGGTIVAAADGRSAVYTPDSSITANADVTVAITVGGTQQDTNRFTVQSVVTGTEFAYLVSATAPALPAPAGQRSDENPPTGWTIVVPDATTTEGVYRISRTVLEVGGTFDSATSDWGWNPNTQPTTPWMLAATTSRLEFAYMRGSVLPTLPNTRTEALPAGWTDSNPGPTTAEGVYRIRRRVTERLGAFVSAGAWSFRPASGSQPWAQASTVEARQDAFRLAQTLDQTTGLPSSTAEALPTGWSATAPDRTQTMGVWRITRTVTSRLGTFVSATAWAWSPVYDAQPFILALDDISDSVRTYTATVRHKATGVLAQIQYTIRSDAAIGIDGAPGRSAISRAFEGTVVGGSTPTATGDIHVGDGSSNITTIDDDNAESIVRLRFGLTNDQATDTLAWRSYLPQVRAGDVVSLYENRTDNWVDLLISTVPTSIAANVRTVEFTVSYLERGESPAITGACFVGFSRAPRGIDGTDGIDGIDGIDGTDGDPGDDGIGHEYIFTSKANATAITGNANLPLQSQNYDIDALRSATGLVRGNQAYYDGVPSDLGANRPYLIRFRRRIEGSPARNADIGNVAWTQEPAIRAVGTDGIDGIDGTDGIDGDPGDDGVGHEYIFTVKANATAITGNANLPLQSQNYDVDALRSGTGLVRGSQAYFDGTPPGLNAVSPYLIRFRRRIEGSPARNADIGNVAWTQEPAIRAYGQKGDTGDTGGVWLRLTRDPVAGDGNNGDWAINTTSYDIFQKQSGAWQSRGNIRGAPGASGMGANEVVIWRLTDVRLDTAPTVTFPATVNWNLDTGSATNNISPWLDDEPVDYNPYEKAKWRGVGTVPADETSSTPTLQRSDFVLDPPTPTDIFNSTNTLYRRGPKPPELPDEDGAN